MNYKNIIPLLIIASFTFMSCDDEIMEWKNDTNRGNLEIAEIPLPLYEKINRYEALKSYAPEGFILGNGNGADLFNNDESYRNLIIENFQEIVPGYAMKHAPMVQADGSIDYTTMDKYIELAQAAGLSVYGHTLVWHSNNDTNYLNSLIAPVIVPTTSGPSILDISGPKNGTLDGWEIKNAGDGITVVDDKGISGNLKAIELKSNATSSNPWNLQLAAPSYSAVGGHDYEISFVIKSDIPGQGRISFGGDQVVDQYPGNGNFETSATWEEVRFTTTALDDSTSIQVIFDLGHLPNVTYYIDVESISVVDLDDNGAPANLITNSDFESGDLTGWGGWGNDSSRAISAEGEGYGDTGYAMVLTNPSDASYSSAQQNFALDAPLDNTKEHFVSFRVKASVNATIQVEFQNQEDYKADYIGGLPVTTEWTLVTFSFTPGSETRQKFFFDFGETAATYYIDDVVLLNGSGEGRAPINIVKTEEQKTQAITEHMESWISGMMTHYKDNVKAWDVVNEPIKNDDTGDIRDGNVSDLPDDHFYWVKYLGKDFAVKAFELARQYGNPDNILFINDYALESNSAKCDGLIKYVEYIESQGATVDGIGTQMHISATTDKKGIEDMFTKLAASGKLIKVSELDVRLGTANPSLEELNAQADMYKFVFDTYMELIPKAQQYGITIWSLGDNPQEHEFWLPDESPNVFDTNYERKPAYMGVANGLAGKDVSKEFSGELPE